ncbi:hypothetical protein [Heyndrickxia ginsengihumi]
MEEESILSFIEERKMGKKLQPAYKNGPNLLIHSSASILMNYQ